jgi:PTH1 family peptidyl-tRNA hydrolase
LWLIVGLGNPGRKYARTRHNAGFTVIEKFADDHNIELTEKKLYTVGKGSVEGAKVVLIKPLTFMNLSGAAVREAFRRFGATPESLIVVHDDLDIEPGRLKIKSGGGTGGHKGIDSIISNIGSKEFIRIKIGIGRSMELPPEKYVLSKFTRQELPAMRIAVEDACEAISTLISSGLEQAMNLYNRKPGPNDNMSAE